PHVLAVQGLNRTRDDDDFSLKVSLQVDDFFTLVTSSSVALSGQATLPGLNRVTVNNQNTTLSSGRWTRTHTLSPGMNRLLVQAWDSGNNLLGTVTNDVVYKPSSTIVSGNINNNTTWSPGGGIVEISSR